MFTAPQIMLVGTGVLLLYIPLCEAHVSNTILLLCCLMCGCLILGLIARCIYVYLSNLDI